MPRRRWQSGQSAVEGAEQPCFTAFRSCLYVSVLPRRRRRRFNVWYHLLTEGDVRRRGDMMCCHRVHCPATGLTAWMTCVVFHHTLDETRPLQGWHLRCPSVGPRVCCIVVTVKGRLQPLPWQLLEVRTDSGCKADSHVALSLRVERLDCALHPKYDTTGW